MPLVTMNTVLQEAQCGKYAVGSFNIVAESGLDAIAGAAVESDSPVILSVCEGHFPYFSFEALSHLVHVVGEALPVPAVMHLDHGMNYETILRALELGYTSVMFDGSLLPFEENVCQTRRVVEAAHAIGIPVEAELGNVGGTEGTVTGGDGALTDPGKAVEFVDRTGCDSLAVAIGTAHGVYKDKPRLDWMRLADIRGRVLVPLVLHGGTGLADDDIRRSIELGISKINVYTQLNLWAMDAVRARLAREPDFNDYPVLLLDTRAAMKAGIAGCMRLFGSAFKARSILGVGLGGDGPVRCGPAPYTPR